MRRSRLLTDVVLTAGDVEVPAHKNMLAACSPYFYAMFTGFTEKVGVVYSNCKLNFINVLLFLEE